ncbi:MAG: phospho-sugar mutase [Gemmiger sp.]|nr:phospho-sugar mutase [Gemmiger sp.]
MQKNDVNQNQELARWLASPVVADADKAELAALQGAESEIQDRFYRDLEFGTGGLRGVLGMGTNRMNIYTVRKATQGLADYLNAGILPKVVAISYDSRNNSALFARQTACVLAANGIVAWLYPRLQPTPALSFAVRDLKAGAGVCVTASHNPAKYNGYKVYGADGCQITLEAADAVLSAIERLDIFADVRVMDFDEGMRAGLIRYIPEETLDRFIQAVECQKVDQSADNAPLKVVYTPLNGAGRECVTRMLADIGVTDVTVVPEQEWPDGNFPTCPYPNPEIRQAMEKGLALCETARPDLLLGTDPDCDRCGIAVPVTAGGAYALMTGNEVGVLLLEYICRLRTAQHTMPQAPVAVTTIVSTAMADPVAKKYGVELRRTLTGFKFIGEQIGLLEAENQADRYIFGFEESYGYLSGGYVRDKDAVNAALLICEAARYYRKQGQTLYEAMQALYAEYGFYRNELHAAAFEGADGMARMQAIMANLRAAPPAALAGYPVACVVDYANAAATGLPGANVLEWRFANGAKLMIRPSGTEPKIKIYLSAVGSTAQQADAINAALAQASAALLQ